MERGEPTVDAVAEAAAARLNQSVVSVAPYEEGMNAVSRVVTADGPDAVLKAGTRTEGSKLLSGPALIERLRRGTDLPVPDVLVVVPDGDEYIECAYFLMKHIDGRRERAFRKRPRATRPRSRDASRGDTRGFLRGTLRETTRRGWSALRRTRLRAVGRLRRVGE